MSTPEQALGRGWQANLSLGFSYAHGKTVLSERQHQGYLRYSGLFILKVIFAMCMSCIHQVVLLRVIVLR